MPETRKKKADWFKIGVYFVCGAVLGAPLGLSLLSEWCDSTLAAIMIILGSSFIVGLLSALLLDRFWNFIIK
jgi:uncharacterized membrane protein YfcA